MSNLDEYHKLVNEIAKHNKLYYQEHTPEISDEQFDHLLKKLEAMEAEHPEFAEKNSPTNRVMESTTEGFRAVAHKVPMLSLANTYNKEEVAQFMKRVEKLTGISHHEYCLELKMDGIAISAIYENGIFIQGLTRGDGQKGDDITANLKRIANLPLTLENAPPFLELRGEVFMPHVEFERLNRLKEEQKELKFANPRNAAAGSLKMLDSLEVEKRGLSVVFYGIAQIEGYLIKTQYEIHDYLKHLNLPVLKEKAFASKIEEIFIFAEHVLSIRKSLAFDIDGIVIKLNDLKEQAALGFVGKTPRYAVAYKFAAEQAETKILNIIPSVGRTGVLTPVAELYPTFLSGSMIARATLHNLDEIERKDIRINDTVIIEKGGDVIPKVVQVNFSLRPFNSKRWEMPTDCPSCGTLVVKEEGEVAYRCPNSQKCPEQALRRIVYFAGKDAFDIENLGEKVAASLFSKNYIKTPADIYILTKDQLATLDNFKDKSIHNLLTSIESSKNVPLDRFIMGLSIPHIGSQTAELLAVKFKSIEIIKHLTKEELMQVEGIGEKVANAIIHFFSTSETKQEIDLLLKRGVVPIPPSVSILEGHPFSGKIFVLTGTLSSYSRSEAAKLIKDRGGKISESVSKKTDFVLTGSEPGSKYEKAKKLKIPILTEEDFTKKIVFK